MCDFVPMRPKSPPYFYPPRWRIEIENHDTNNNRSHPLGRVPQLLLKTITYTLYGYNLNYLSQNFSHIYNESIPTLFNSLWAWLSLCRIVISVLKHWKQVMNNTPNKFRSCGHRRFTRVYDALPAELQGLCLAASVKRPKWNNTGNPFRSSDLGVMSPARCLCAMPVKRNDIDSEFRSHDLPNKLSEVFHWYMSTPLHLVSSLTSHFFKTAKEENTGGRFRSYDLPLIRR